MVGRYVSITSIYNFCMHASVHIAYEIRLIFKKTENKIIMLHYFFFKWGGTI